MRKLVFILALFSCNNECRFWNWEANFQIWHKGSVIERQVHYSPEAYGTPGVELLRREYESRFGKVYRGYFGEDPDSVIVDLSQECQDDLVTRFRYRL